MPLADHFREFRSRLLKAALAVMVGAVVAFLLWPRILDVLTVPLCEVRDDLDVVGPCELVFFGPFDALLLRLKMSLVVGVVLAAPVWLWQVWQFVTPGLYRRERRWALIFTSSATVLFLLGAFVAYLLLEAGLRLLLAAGGESVVPLLEVGRYLSYVSMMIFVFGVSFLLPLFVVVLNLAGVLTYATAARWRRLTWFLLAVFAAFATPSQDPVSMLALALPMVFLYEAALVVARLHDRRAARRASADASLDAALSDHDVSPVPEPEPVPPPGPTDD